jgi:hypothetical protein
VDKRVTLKIPRRLYNRARTACKQETTVNALATFLVQAWVDDKERDSSMLPSAATVRTLTRAERRRPNPKLDPASPYPADLGLSAGGMVARRRLFLASIPGNYILDSGSSVDARGGIVPVGPMTSTAEGKQYVAVNAGNSLFVFGLRD